MGYRKGMGGQTMKLRGDSKGKWREGSREVESIWGTMDAVKVGEVSLFCDIWHDDSETILELY
jgi:hypothetical protein